MNHLYLLKLNTTNGDLPQPESILFFNTQYNLENLKNSKPALYIELLSNLLTSLNLTKHTAVQFLESSEGNANLSFKNDDLHSPTKLVELLQSDHNIQIQATLQEDSLRIVMNEPSLINQRNFDMFGLLFPNADKTALFEPLIESVINLEKIPLPELDQLLSQLIDKTVLNADPKYLTPIYINEHNQLVVLGEVSLSIVAGEGLKIQNYLGKFILENANAKALSLNHCFKPFCDELNPSNTSKERNFQRYQFYSKEKAKEIVSNLSVVEKETLKKHLTSPEKWWHELEHVIYNFGKQRVFNEMSSILLYEQHDRIMQWLVMALMRNMSAYLNKNKYKQMNEELLPLITFVDNLN